ncbi:MAG TPA: class I fructose-bisphosphate aldolase [Mycobacteriales bacterium]|nr:class I fructose-bisphosphate aldolase [Mycobacteriales bacterium]
MDLDSMTKTARALVAPGKGILAADESTPTIEKRFRAVGLDSTESLRRDYRELLFTADGTEQFISGVILFDETIRQHTSSGTAFPATLADRGVIPGIKVDRGTIALAGFPGEVITEGLDGLRDRLAEYAAMGAQFAKWRAVISIGSGRPTGGCLDANAHALARYAALTQEAGLVPIVEPEVLMDGDHSIDRCAEVTAATLRAVYDQLARQRVVLEASLLKPNMVLAGKENPQQPTLDEVADATIAVLRNTVPAAVPGIVFLSGGQSDTEATARLNALNKREPQPWQLSFSFGRALQAPVLRAWAGDDAHRDAAKAALLHRAAMNGAARHGAYNPDQEQPRASAP